MWLLADCAGLADIILTGGWGVLTGQGRAWLESQQLSQFPVRAGETCVLFLHFFIACLLKLDSIAMMY